MRCPYCLAEDDAYKKRHYVKDVVDYGFAIKRIRLCWNCNRKFYTFEKYDQDELKENKNEEIL